MSYYTNFKRKGNTLWVRHVNDDGVESILKEKIESGYFIECEDSTDAVSLFGTNLKRSKPMTRKEVNSAVGDYTDAGIRVFGNNKSDYVLLDSLYGDHLAPKPESIKTMFIDIETEIDMERGFSKPENAFMPINAIAVVVGGVVLSLSTIKYTGGGFENAIFKHFDSEADLLQYFIKCVQKARPHIISGWNSTAFDLPYIAKRIELLFGEDEVKKLSPFGSYSYRMVLNKYKQEDLTLILDGVSDLDYLLLYRKYTVGSQKPSYKLDDIVFDELNERKGEYTGTLQDFYINDPNGFLEYNIKDATLIQRLDIAKNYILLVVEMAYFARVNFEDTFFVTRVWDSILTNYLAKDNIIMPWASSDDKDEQYEGAFVLPPIVGFYEWAVSFDVASMYPSLIIQQNISPECKVGKVENIKSEDFLQLTDAAKSAIIDARKNGHTISANGVLYSKEKQGFLPKLVSEVLDNRKVAKKQMQAYQRELEVIKEQLNNLG